jgi:phage terminase Nu1 subunit (DNA packaging protein)
MTKNTSSEDLKKITVNGNTMGEILGVGDRMVRDLAEDGTLERNGRGRYLLMESLRRYILMLKVSKSDGKSATDDTYIDLDSERAKHERLKTQITEIKLQLIKGNVHRSEDVERVITDMFEKFKSKMLAIPPTMARKLEGKSRQEIQDILLDKITKALVELSDYKPEDYYSKEYIEQEDDAEVSANEPEGS